ncbi:hypothetical protein RCH18_001367 [Flavobacterium sp. PL11]|uniref:hypothetical protein n=1 Tax=Flavobacterium sp. PL11 TaxID=3071717 RepID=UPI002E0C9B0A|nr:hypothetical protein [Flavobacterium sp. PL11]
MTAIVGILNKQAVAMAADSAVTIGGSNGKKIFNKANKVFALSKCHPVGIMIYNAASFMGTPWETIIKVYRKQLKDKSFNTLNEYQVDFLAFLKSKKYYTDDTIQSDFLKLFTLDIVNLIINDAIAINNSITLNPTAENRVVFLENLEVKVDNLMNNWIIQTNFCPEFEDYTFENFEAYSNDIFNEINENRFIQNEIIVSDELFLKIKKTVFYLLRAKENFNSFTGLIFTGFGEDEIYPSLIPVFISMVIDNRLHYFIDDNQIAKISNDNSGSINPFAQTDVINTILTGIDPSLNTIYLNNFEELLKKYNQTILAAIGDTNPLLTEQISNLDINAIVGEFNSLNQQIKRENYIVPLMDAVSNLDKEDLAEMAESLIYLTYLKRRITFAEESVGGPVDVAIISKGDGFVWIKRKHYFRPELNQHFFDNYFK